MSGRRKRKDDDFIDDTDLGEDSPRKKPSKKENISTDYSEGTTVCELSKNRKVIVKQFKTMVLIDIREYFSDKAGDQKPTKKGISLTLEQWKVLRDHIKDVDEVIDELS